MQFKQLITSLPEQITLMRSSVLLLTGIICISINGFASDSASTTITDSIMATPAVQQRNVSVSAKDSLYTNAKRVMSGSTGRTKISTPDTTDTTARQLRRDSLVTAEHHRKGIFQPYSDSFTTTSVTSRTIFTSDATSWYDLRELRRNYSTARTGIAHSFNRLQFMGNTAPLRTFFAGMSLIPSTPKSPYSAEFAQAPQIYSSASFATNGMLSFEANSDLVVSPETFIFWENGVFDENTLSFRSTRLVGRSLQMSIFSHNQYFKNMKFSHDGNDIYTLFSTISSDTSLLSDRGYNPLVKEFTSGMDITWQGNDATLFSRITYRDCSDEIPLNRPFTDGHPVHQKLTQYPLMLQTRYSYTPSPSSYINAETRIVSNRQIINRTTTGTNQLSLPQRIKLQTTDFTGSFRAGIALHHGDSTDITGTINRYTTGVPDSVSLTTYNFHPELRYAHSLSTMLPNGAATLKLGTDLFTNKHDTAIGLTWSASTTARLFANQCALYVEQNIDHYYPHFDSLDAGILLHDSYLRAGLSIERTMKFAVAQIGYQYYLDPDIAGIARTWINGTPPYEQPQSVLLLAATVGRLRGIGIDSRILLSDTKPYVKLQYALSYLVFPQLNKESVELSLGVDYWSSRNMVTFAGDSLWHREILDVNFKTTVHIKSFRMFYKIDNLLNRKFSYLPGYFAPGITFRWGFSWFIPR